MGRYFNEKKQTTRTSIYDLSICAYNYLKERAIMESKRNGRVVSISRIIANIVSENMKNEGYSCG